MGGYPSSVQDVFSHSSLSSYENCPRKYAFRYIEKIQVDSEGIEAFVGKRVHEILERLYQFVDDGVVPPYRRSSNDMRRISTRPTIQKKFELLETT